MDWLSTAGALFLLWFVIVFLFTLRHQLPSRPAHVRARAHLRDSDEVSFDRWQGRPLWEKIVGPFVWILERQQ